MSSTSSEKGVQREKVWGSFLFFCIRFVETPEDVRHSVLFFSFCYQQWTFHEWGGIKAVAI